MKKAILMIAGCMMSTGLWAQADTSRLRMYTPQNQPTLQPEQNSNKSFENNSLYYNRDNRLDKSRYSTPQPNGSYQSPGYSNPSQGTTPNVTAPSGTINNTNPNNINKTR